MLVTAAGEVAETAHGAIAGANKADSNWILIAIFAHRGALWGGDDEVGSQRKCLVVACDYKNLGVIAECLIKGF